MAGCVEKVLATAGPNFLRAAGALYAVAHGGPHQNAISREIRSEQAFSIGSISDFFNRIDPELTSPADAKMWLGLVLEALHGIFIPFDASTRSIRNLKRAGIEAKRLLQDRISPILPFQPVPSFCHTH